MGQLTIGVLALQGCVGPHRKHIESLGAIFMEVRDAQGLEQVDGLILPGGESTTMLKLIDTFSLEECLRKMFNRVPVWGICAGAILMARRVRSPEQRSFDLLDIEVERNAYGRQQESFHAGISEYPVSFIRAPKILWAGKNVQVHATQANDPVWVHAGRYMATTFHPELTDDCPSPMHRKFMELVEMNRKVRVDS